MTGNTIPSLITDLLMMSKESNETIMTSLTRAISNERSATAALISYLAEYEHRGLHLRDGYASIYAFLTVCHGYSEGAAARRSVVARFARANPEVLTMIAAGDLSLSVADVLARAVTRKELDPKHIPALLGRCKRKSKTEAEQLLAEFGVGARSPQSKERVRAVPVRALSFNHVKTQTVNGTATSPSENFVTTRPSPFNDSHDSVFAENKIHDLNQNNVLSSEDANDGNSVAPGNPPTTDANFPSEQPIEFQVSLRFSADAMKHLRRAQDLLGTKDLASTIERLALTHNQRKDPLAAKQGRQTHQKDRSKPEDQVSLTPPAESHVKLFDKSAEISAETSDDSPASKSTHKHRIPITRSRYIPAAVRRTVHQKSGGQCCYVNAATGRRCGERRNLQIDHVQPYALGGTHEVRNLQVLCRPHNLMRARDTFGAAPRWHE
jgi:hypothetical protein